MNTINTIHPTAKQLKWHKDEVARFVNDIGRRFDNVTMLTFTGAICGLSAEEVTDECRQLMPDFSSEHANNIRRGICSACRALKRQPQAAGTPQQPDKGYPEMVKEMIVAGGCKAELADLQKVRGGETTTGLTEREQTRIFLSRLFQPQDLIHIENSQQHRTARIGASLRTRDEWLDELALHRLKGDIIGRNPYSGKLGTTGGGKTSLTASSCVESHTYALIEFDRIPIEEQAAFWIGVLAEMSKIADSLVSLVYSGGKSIHGLLRINRIDPDARKAKDFLRRLFCSADEEAFRADPMGLIPRGGTRLAGARRIDNGNLQQLLFIK